jgi:pimeloyl-ACP methyl ester carboxylesterase
MTKNRVLIMLMVATLVLSACAPKTNATPIPLTAEENTIPPTSVVLKGSLTVGDSTSGQYRLDMSCQGEGAPVVVLDSGVNGEGQYWFQVENGLKAITQVCSYQRTGGPNHPITIEEMTNDLHDLLAATGVKGPYVLVGQSFAGMRVRLFTYEFSDEVVGMVLVDPDHEDASARDAAVLPPESPDDSVTLKEIRAILASPDTTQDPSVNYSEVYAQMHTANKSLGDLPLIVLTAGKGDWPLDLEPAVASALDQSKLKLHEDIAQLSTNSQHLIISGSGHNIHVEKPEAVIDAIQQVIEAVRKGNQLTK